MSFFGGSLTPAGNLSTRPRRGTTFRTSVLLEKLVRFDLAKAQGTALLTDQDISRILHRSTRRLSVIRASEPYLRKRIELTTGISTDSETSVEEAIVKHKQLLRLLMPDAMRVLADQLQSKPISSIDKRLQTTVALEVLDREGTFPKISRSDVHTKIEHDYSEMDKISRSLLEAINSDTISPEISEKRVAEALRINNSFSNSETLTSAEQEAALAALESIKVTGLVN